MFLTVKSVQGKDFPDVENLLSWHGKPLGPKAAEIIAHLGN
jgi:transketolase